MTGLLREAPLCTQEHAGPASRAHHGGSPVPAWVQSTARTCPWPSGLCGGSLSTTEGADAARPGGSVGEQSAPHAARRGPRGRHAGGEHGGAAGSCVPASTSRPHAELLAATLAALGPHRRKGNRDLSLSFELGPGSVICGSRVTDPGPPETRHCGAVLAPVPAVLRADSASPSPGPEQKGLRSVSHTFLIHAHFPHMEKQGISLQ